MTVLPIALPAPFLINRNAGTGTISDQSLVSAQVPVGTETTPKLGVKRKLINVACAINATAVYRYNGTASVSTPATSTHLLATLLIFKNQQQVYTTSAQIEMPEQAWTYDGGQNYTFTVANSYGIFSDFVNPIDVANSDQLAIGLILSGYELFTNTFAGGPYYYLNQVYAGLSSNGYIYYQED